MVCDSVTVDILANLSASPWGAWTVLLGHGQSDIGIDIGLPARGGQCPPCQPLESSDDLPVIYAATPDQRQKVTEALRDIGISELDLQSFESQQLSVLFSQGYVDDHHQCVLLILAALSLPGS